MDRRSSLKLLAVTPLTLAAGCTLSSDDVQQAHEQATAQPDSRVFFTDREFETVSVLADLILPADERSGSASDLGVPAFMDFIVFDKPALHVPVRGGLAWLNVHTIRRTGKPFLETNEAERRTVLDEIAYPDDADPSVAHGVTFFNLFRDLVASGYWTTKEGMADLRYEGNVPMPTWTGPPQAELERLDLSFDDWDVA